MPELPEVETTCRGIEPHIKNQIIQQVIIRQEKLRWIIPSSLIQDLVGKTVLSVHRRAKYLLINIESGTLMIHLGMSGSLRILDKHTPPQKHDHFELVFNSQCLRLRDPRRFGAVLWTQEPIENHCLIHHLGPEPLTKEFTGKHLHQQAKKRTTSIKQFIMDAKVVVGVGNIYANEALFMTGIHPQRRCHRIAKARYEQLAHHIKIILKKAIQQGGTTLKDFSQQDGKPGYFAQSLQVYGRTGEACPTCTQPITRITIGQRSSFYCKKCQT